MKSVSRNIVFLLSLMMTPASLAELALAEVSAQSTDVRPPAKKGFKVRSGPASAAAVGVRFTWQTITSQGQGSKMNTSAETFMTDGKLVQTAANQWQLMIGDREAAATVNNGSKGKDGTIFIDRADLLRVLNVNLDSRLATTDMDPSHRAALEGGIQLVLSRNPNRQMETVYRAPDEELFLVKVSALLIAPK